MRASDVTLKPVAWLEFPFVPLGKITAVAGQMGQAKSLSACWLTSEVTNNGGRVIAKRQLAVVLVQHLNRRSDAGGDPLARIADSQGIPRRARSVLVWGPDPADPEGDRGKMKALTRAKGNLTKATASATFTVVERVVTDQVVAPTRWSVATTATSAPTTL